MVVGLHYFECGPSDHLHVSVQGFNFTKKKIIWVGLFQILKHFFTSDCKQELSRINVEIKGDKFFLYFIYSLFILNTNQLFLLETSLIKLTPVI